MDYADRITRRVERIAGMTGGEKVLRCYDEIGRKLENKLAGTSAGVKAAQRRMDERMEELPPDLKKICRDRRAR